VVDSEQYKAVFENRKSRYMFGCNNYGEIPKLLNSSDGDAWDIFAPGYSYKHLKFDQEYKIKDLIGVFQLKNGNHKLAIKVYVNDFDESKAKLEIKRYVNIYKRRTGKIGKWIAFDNDYRWSNL